MPALTALGREGRLTLPPGGGREPGPPPGRRGLRPILESPTRVATMPQRLRPTAPIAADAILVGDPGRALMLAQELLEQPKMANHARGLWGYSGRTPAGEELSVMSTGMGGPSAALVLADLAELGVRRAVRVGTATALRDGEEPGGWSSSRPPTSAGGADAGAGARRPTPS